MPTPIDSFNLQKVSEGQFTLSGDVTLKTVMALKKQSNGLFNGASEIQFDLSGVTKVDSAALALVLEWIEHARKSEKPIRFIKFPVHLQDIAVAYDIDKELPIS